MADKTENSGPSSTKTYLGIFGGFLFGLFLLMAIVNGLSGPSLGDDEVAKVENVDNGAITQSELDAGIERSAAELGLGDETPQPGDPQYDSIREQVISNLIIATWVRGEAAEEGITASEEEIDEQLDQIKQQSFNGNDKQFRRFATSQGFCTSDELKDGGKPEACEGIREQVELSILRDSLQEEVVQAVGKVSDADIEDFYEANIDNFRIPANRDLRVILNEDKAKVEEARELLSADDSDDNWEKVAKRLSSDAASKNRGGLLQGVTEGQFGEDFDERAFSIPEGKISKPFRTDRGFYIVQVDQINDESTRPLSEAAPQIQQQLAAASQEAAGTKFQNDFVAKWSSRTACADDVAVAELCDDTKPDEVDEEQILAAGDGQFPPPPVISTRPIAPGEAIFQGPSSTPQQGLPQTPRPPVAAAPALDPSGLPAGAQQIPPTGP